tara:strand:- start:844 stop:1404 length:561 start_codon:yes stop_codon:yes gene_type:complete
MTDTETINNKINKIRERIRSIPDYPKPGIMFRDITTLLKDPDGLFDSVDVLSGKLDSLEFNKVAAIDARGFIFGAAISFFYKKGFIPVRKKNKLPGDVISEEYELEYGMDQMELHVDAIQNGDKILLVDDLIATGGTAIAAISLIERLGGVIAAASFVVGLPDLGGITKLKDKGYLITTICDFEGE